MSVKSNRYSNYLKSRFLSKKEKIFCIGCNKTGTTSLAQAMNKMGFHVAPQARGERLLKNYINNDLDSIISFVRRHGVFFQDVPFSLPEVFKHIDKAFPESKFILTIRDSSDVWYNSISKFHSKLFGGGNIPSKELLMNANYIYKGWIWDFMKVYGGLDHAPYDEESLKNFYNKYNEDVLSYFRDKPDKLLVVNLKDSNAISRLADFIGVSDTGLEEMPWANKT
ncbi:MAG: hypothetical protein CMP61_09540 [Flavobacteriales bacterium]|nr:hypothetical protein [Flavobacteriales bacterium]|tara:strand:+ start:17771 stop:18442 length:672 start_codon:yes stop_codon:yes gene_type:complete